jgi:hypothetical protein
MAESVPKNICNFGKFHALIKKIKINSQNSVGEDENLNQTQEESLNSELQTFFYELFCKQQRAGISNSRKYFIF